MDQKQRRLELHQKLKEILESDYVYFQPPANVKMHYPCIRYTRDGANVDFADDYTYKYTQRYSVTAIYLDPDSDLPYKLQMAFQMITPDRHYVEDNLHHDVFSLYY